MRAECLACETTHRTSCKTVRAGFKAVSDNVNKMQTIMLVLQLLGQFRSHRARFENCRTALKRSRFMLVSNIIIYTCNTLIHVCACTCTLYILY